MPHGPVVILGAGLTGLSAAVALKRRGVQVTVLESSVCAGGAVGTGKDGGFLVERGPNSMMVNDADVAAFLSDLGLDNEIIQPQAKKRFLVRGGKPIALPAGPLGAVATPIFSLPGKLRILAEPFIPRGADNDESLADLVRRRLGPELLTYAIEPFVAGIYAGDPEKLSARYAFPKLWNLEKEHGSFIRAALRLRRTGPPQKMISFRDGMGALPDRLSALLGEGLRCNARVESIAQSNAGWSVSWSEQGTEKRAACSAIICTIPAYAVPQLPWPDALREGTGILSRIDYPPVTVVALGFRRDAVRHPLDGFGMLVPSVEKRRILGTIFSSSLFPGRVPEGNVLLTTFVGGARQPRVASLGDDALVEDVCRDLRDLLGVEAAPVFQRIIRWPRAIPQYDLSYGVVLAGLEKLEEAHPGLHFAGNYRGGIAAGQCILNGLRLAEKIAAEYRT